MIVSAPAWTKIDVTQEKVAAQRAWKAQTSQLLPTLRRFLCLGDRLSRSAVAQAGDNRVQTAVGALGACRATFGAEGVSPRTPTLLAAFKGVPTDKLSDEIAMAYQLQRFYDLQGK